MERFQFNNYHSLDIIRRLLNRRSELKHSPDPVPIDIANALALTVEGLYMFRKYQALSNVYTCIKDGRGFRTVPKHEIVTAYLLDRVEDCRNRLHELFSKVMSFIEKVATRCIWVRYLLLTPMYRFVIPLVAVIADPPANIDPISWVNGLIPSKNTTDNVRAEFHYMMIRGRTFPLEETFYLDRLLELYVDPIVSCDRLREIVIRKYDKELGKGRSRERALLLTLRDIIRIFLLSSYLVYTYHKARNGKVSLEVKHLRKLKLERLLNPIELVDRKLLNYANDLVPSLGEIEWSWIKQYLNMK